MRLGVLTLVPARGAKSTQNLAAKVIAKAVPVLKPGPSVIARSLAAQTPRVPGFAPGTILQLDSRTGAGQIAERTYEPVETAAQPVTTGAWRGPWQGAPAVEKTSLALPAIIAAALYFMG